MYPTKWTPAKLEEAKRLYTAGEKVDYIARLLGITRQTLHRAASQYSWWRPSRAALNERRWRSRITPTKTSERNSLPQTQQTQILKTQILNKTQ